MSFLTGTNVELIYVNTASGTAKNTFTIEATPILNDVAGMGAQAALPAYFFQPGKIGQGLKIVARGIMSSTATPTFQFIIRLGATGIAAPIVWEQTSVATTASGAANKHWELEVDLLMRINAGAGGNSTVQGLGFFRGGGDGWAAASQVLGGFANNASPGTVATFDNSIVNTININAICSASSASNQLQLLQLLVYGLN